MSTPWSPWTRRTAHTLGALSRGSCGCWCHAGASALVASPVQRSETSRGFWLSGRRKGVACQPQRRSVALSGRVRCAEERRRAAAGTCSRCQGARDCRGALREVRQWEVRQREVRKREVQQRVRGGESRRCNHDERPSLMPCRALCKATPPTEKPTGVTPEPGATRHGNPDTGATAGASSGTKKNWTGRWIMATATATAPS